MAITTANNRPIAQGTHSEQGTATDVQSMRAAPHHHEAYVAGAKDKNQIPMHDVPHKNYMWSQRHSRVLRLGTQHGFISFPGQRCRDMALDRAASLNATSAAGLCWRTTRLQRF